jgi:hypothetical protein
MVYFALTRSTYSGGAMLIAFAMFTGGFKIAKELLRRPIFVRLGNLCLIMGIITPITIAMFYNMQKDGNFVSFNWVLGVGLSNACMVIFYATCLYILWEWPTTQLVKKFLLPYLS